MPIIAHQNQIIGQATNAEALVKDTVGWTGKNLLKNTATTQTINGVTFTVNADKSVTVNGTATANTDFHFNTPTSRPISELQNGMILSGLSEGANDAFELSVIYRTSADAYISKDNVYGGREKSLVIPQNASMYRCCISVYRGITVNNKTVYPMIRRADITDPTYEPYHESVEVMYEEEIHGVNLLKNKAVTTTAGNVTFTVNSNGSVTINSNGATSGNQFLPFGYFTLPKGSYILSHGHSIESEVHFSLYISTPDLVVIASQRDDQSEARFTISTDTVCQGVIRAYDGKTINNTTVYPMLRKADIDDPTYRPYNYQAIQNQLNAQGVLGAKNLLQNVGSTITQNGITATYNSDGSILLNGTATANIGLVVSKDVSNNNFLPNGKYILSGSAVFSDNCFLWMNKYVSGSGSYLVQLKTSGEVEFAIDTSQYDGIKVGITVRNGATLSNFLVKPMIRLASDPDDTYQPYAMTNRELTEKINGKNLTISTSNASITLGTETYCKIFGSIIIGSLQFTTSAEIAKWDSIASIAYGSVPVNKGKFMFAALSDSQDVYRVSVEAGNTSNMGVWVNDVIPTGKTCKFTFVLFV